MKTGLIDLKIYRDGDTWRVIGAGATRDGKTMLHLASLTRGQNQKNGFCPLQICDWVEADVIQSALAQREEEARIEANANHAGPCVQWRGRGGKIGACIYCGKDPDPITSYYTDRANSGLAALAK